MPVAKKAAKKRAARKKRPVKRVVKQVVTNQSDLAFELGTNHRTIKSWILDDRYVERRPSKKPNGTYRISEYREWMRYHDLPKVHKGNEENASTIDQRLKRKLTEIKVEQERAKLEKMTGELVLKSDIEEALGRGMSFLLRELDRVFGDEIPPRTRGLSEKQISKMNRDEIKGIFREAKQRFAEGMEGL